MSTRTEQPSAEPLFTVGQMNPTDGSSVITRGGPALSPIPKNGAQDSVLPETQPDRQGTTRAYAAVSQTDPSNGSLVERFSQPLVRKITAPAEHFIALQTWEGYVEEIHETSFSARLVDLSDRSRADEITEFDLDEVSEFDRDLLAPGAVFYWSIGQTERRTGQREGRSFLRFRRLPIWSRSEIRDLERETDELSERLGWGTQTRQSATTQSA